MRFSVLRAVPADSRDLLLDLWVAAWTPTMPGIDFGARRFWFSGHLEALLAEGAWLVLAHTDETQRIAGFFMLDPETGEIDQLAVHPASGGRGIGSACLDEAKRLAPAGLRLTVNQANNRAASLYGRAGFVVTGEAINPRSGLPVWTMAWPA